MITIKQTILALLLGAAVMGSASAALIIYDGFDYSTGTLAGDNGGSGWTSPWTQSGTSTVLSVVSPGLSYNQLQVTGNAISDTTTSSQIAYRSFDTTGLMADGNSVWFSLLYSVSAGGDSMVKFFANGMHPTANYQTGVGIRISNTQGIATDFGVVAFSYKSFAHGANANMVAGRLTFSDQLNQDRITLWVNPNLGEGTPADGAAFSDVLGQVSEVWPEGQAAIGNEVVIRGGGSFIGVFDELRVGTSFADVAPIPEPAVYGLSLAALALFMGLRSKRAR